MLGRFATVVRSALQATRHAILATAFTALGFAPALADPIVLTKLTCTTLNCQTFGIGARINAHPASPVLANTWTGQFSSATASCLRFAVTSQTADLAMTVVAPNGTVYVSDNSGIASCTTCPVVVVGTAVAGFYTVIVGVRSGQGVEASFSLRPGLYNTGNNPNCTSPTTGK